jgi:hypothetical protein
VVSVVVRVDDGLAQGHAESPGVVAPRCHSSPVSKTNGNSGFRNESTVGLWMVAVRSFCEWADADSLLATDVVSRMTELKYFAPGTAGGGERGAMRRVLVEELRSKRVEAPPPRWISDAGARNRLGDLMLPARDRFLIDLLTTRGIRVGEALSLFVADLHFGGGESQKSVANSSRCLQVLAAGCIARLRDLRFSSLSHVAGEQLVSGRFTSYNTGAATSLARAPCV